MAALLLPVVIALIDAATVAGVAQELIMPFIATQATALEEADQRLRQQLPLAVLTLPVVLFWSVLAPLAVLPLPVVLATSALSPRKVLELTRSQPC